MNSKKDNREIKRPYEKPKLITIELAVEEILGTGCKLAAGGGDVAPPTCLLGTCIITPGS